MPFKKKEVAKTKKEKNITEESLQKNDGKKDLIKAFYDSLKKDHILGDINKKINFISTGSWVLNKIIGDGTHKGNPGGIPRGYITEIFGDEGCGKTTLALHLVKEAQRAGGRVIYADFEHSLRTQFKYIENIGVDVNPPNFTHITADYFEQGVQKIGEALLLLKPTLIVVDSVTGMLPKDAYKSDADAEIAIGKLARLTGNFVNWINKYLERYDTALVMLNQLRSVIKKSQYEAGPNETTSGGKALKFFSSIRLQMKVLEKEEVASKSEVTGASEKKFVNQTVKVTVAKSKLDMPFMSAPIYITFGKGINNILSIIQLAANKHVFRWSEEGNVYSWEDPNKKLSFKLKGRNAVLQYIEQHPEILEIIKPSLTFTQDTEEMLAIKKDLEAKGLDKLSEDEQETLKDLNSKLGGSIVEEPLADVDQEALESLKDLTESMKETTESKKSKKEE